MRIVKKEGGLVPLFGIFAICSLLSSFSAIPLGVSAKQCFVFSLHQIFLVFLPGLAAFSLLSREKTVHPLILFFSSFAIGYGITILVYFLVALVGLSRPNMILFSVITAGALLAGFALKKHDTKTGGLKKTDLLFLLLFLVFYLVAFYGYCGNTLPSEKNPSVYYHQDGLYWIENAVSLKISFPPEELRFSGMKLYYHYFASIYVAMASFVTGIDCFTVGYSLYNLCRCMLVFGGLFFAAYELIPKDSLRIAFLASVLFTTGIERYTLMKYVNQLVFLPFGFDIALGYGAYSIALFCKQFKSEAFRLDLCLLAALSMFLCAGHKAPVALVYMVFAGMICLHWLVKKQYRKAFLCGGAAVVLFSLVMVVCAGFLLPGESRVTAGHFSLNATLKNTHFYEVLHAYRRLAGAGSFSEKLVSAGTWCASMVLLIVCIHPLLWASVLFGILSHTRAKKWDAIDVALLVSVAFGTAMGLFNEQDGMSQIYYCLAGYVPGFLFAAKSFAAEKNKPHRIRAVCLAVLFLCSVKYCLVDAGVIRTAQYVINKIYSQEPSDVEGNDEDGYPANTVQLSDYQALCWIRDHTPYDSLLVSDRDIRLEQRIYMCHGTFSERRMYLEGDVYLYGAYAAEREERRDRIRWLYLNDREAFEAVKKDGVDYIIQTKWIKPDYQGNGCTLVFENETIKVWKVDPVSAA